VGYDFRVMASMPALLKIGLKESLNLREMAKMR
jgi:hypothetical protein